MILRRKGSLHSEKQLSQNNTMTKGIASAHQALYHHRVTMGRKPREYFPPRSVLHLDNRLPLNILKPGAQPNFSKINSQAHDPGCLNAKKDPKSRTKTSQTWGLISSWKGGAFLEMGRAGGSWVHVRGVLAHGMCHMFCLAY